VFHIKEIVASILGSGTKHLDKIFEVLLKISVKKPQAIRYKTTSFLVYLTP